MLSVTDLSTYEYCKRKLYLSKNFGLREPPKPAAMRGSSIHHFYELINDAEKEIVMQIDSEDMTNIEKTYSEAYAKILDDIESDADPETFKKIMDIAKNETEKRAENTFKNIKRHHLLGERLWGVFTPKIRSELRVASGQLGMVGIIDTIKEYDDEIIPIEMKTGSAPKEGIWPAHRLQLASYMTMLSAVEKKKIRRGIVFYVDAQIEREIKMNPFIREEIIKKISAVNLSLNGKLPAYVENKRKCEACGLRETCYDGGKIKEITEKHTLKTG